MITDAMPPAPTPVGLILNILTFFAGFLLSVTKVPSTMLAEISLTGSIEVIWYGAVGGITSLTVKYLGEYLVSNHEAFLMNCSTWLKRGR